MNKTSPGLSLLLLVLLSAGCGIFRPAAGEAVDLPGRSAKFLVKKMAQNQVQCDWFSARARIDFKDDNYSVSATANLRMRNDSVIWANVKKLNLEMGRVLIRPDSFFVVDRINRQYSRQSVDEIAQMLQVPANFQILESILLGNPFFLNTELEAGVEEGFYTLKGEDKRFAVTYHLDGKDFSLRRFSISEKQEKRLVSMELKGYEALGKKQKFSYFRTMRMESPESGPVSVEIEFSKVEIDIPKSIEFEIPSRYDEINRP